MTLRELQESLREVRAVHDALARGELQVGDEADDQGPADAGLRQALQERVGGADEERLRGGGGVVDSADGNVVALGRGGDAADVGHVTGDDLDAGGGQVLVLGGVADDGGHFVAAGEGLRQHGTTGLAAGSEHNNLAHLDAFLAPKGHGGSSPARK